MVEFSESFTGGTNTKVLCPALDDWIHCLDEAFHSPSSACTEGVLKLLVDRFDGLLIWFDEEVRPIALMRYLIQSDVESKEIKALIEVNNSRLILREF